MIINIAPSGTKIDESKIGDYSFIPQGFRPSLDQYTLRISYMRYIQKGVMRKHYVSFT